MDESVGADASQGENVGAGASEGVSKAICRQSVAHPKQVSLMWLSAKWLLAKSTCRKNDCRQSVADPSDEPFLVHSYSAKVSKIKSWKSCRFVFSSFKFFRAGLMLNTIT